MTDTPATSSKRRSHPPLWLVEGLDVVEQRRPVLIAVTIGVVVLGGILALLAPGLVPPVPLVGAAVGVAALLLGLAVAVALDAADLRLRGPRHVGAAGGELVAVLPTAAEPVGAEVLADAVLEARAPGSPLLLGLAASGRDVRPTVAWTDALATALEAQGVSVLRIDLASGHTRSPGLLEVVRDGVKLASAVTFGPEPKLARLGAGEDLDAALGALAALPGRLPRDLDVLLVALPMAASRSVVTAVRSLDHVLIVAQRDRTSRVELIAGLDALEAAGTRAQVALLDDRIAARLAVRSTAAADVEAADETEEASSGSSRPGRVPTDDIPPPRADEVDEGTAVGHGVEVPEPASEAEVAPEDEAAPGPRSGGAFGVGGAALTAAGTAAAFTPPQPGTAEGDGEPAESSLDERESSPEAVESPKSETSVLGLEDDSELVGLEFEGLDEDLGVEWLSWDDAPREAEGEDDVPREADGQDDAPREAASGDGAPDPAPAPDAVADAGFDPAPAPDAVADAGLDPAPAPDAVADPVADPDPVADDGFAEAPTASAPSHEVEQAGPSTPVEGAAPERSERRDVEVVNGAAEATAIGLVQLPVELPFGTQDPAIDAGGALPVGGGAGVPTTAAPDLPPAPVALHADTEADTAPASPGATDSATGPDTQAAEGEDGSAHGDEPRPSRSGSRRFDGTPHADPGADDPNRTEEIPTVRAQREISETDAERDEMMRTTAQLSVLLDEDDAEGDEHPRDTP